jgi:prophage regulatory protein
MSRTGLGRSSLYAAIKRGDFPVPVKIGARAVGFIAQEVDAWIAAKVAKRTENSR